MYNSYSALDVAKRVAQQAIDNGNPLNNLQLQHILYMLQMNCLAHNNRVLLADFFQAWQCGPVIPSVYYHFCGFGAMPISHVFSAPVLDVDTMEDIKNVLNAIGDKPYYALGDITMREGGAWEKTFQRQKYESEIIPITLMTAEAQKGKI